MFSIARKLLSSRIPNYVPLLGAATITMMIGIHTEARATDAEEGAKAALESFITAWNTGEDASLRKTMHFPFVSLWGARAIQVADAPEDFSAGFVRMRQHESWSRSAFDFDSFEVFLSSADKVHCAIDYERYNTDGKRYAGGRVMYVVTKREDRWGVQMRTQGGVADPLSDAERDEAINGARRAALDFMTAFNAGDADGSSRPLNYPHIFMFTKGGVAVAPDSAHGSVRPDFERMRQNQNWHFSSFDSLETSIVTADKVYLEVVFSRWHPDGTRYLTIPALWIATRDGDHWGIQLRSLMAPKLSEQPN
jgi:hypothetical protein